MSIQGRFSTFQETDPNPNAVGLFRAEALRRVADALHVLAVTVDEAARYLGISASTFHRLKKHGHLPQPRELPGSNSDDRYLRADLDEWARALPQRDAGGTR